MLDGKITNDSAPLSDDEIKTETKKNEEELKKNSKKKTKKPSMSFFTSLSLSLKNLFTKKGRSTHVCGFYLITKFQFIHYTNC